MSARPPLYRPEALHGAQRIAPPDDLDRAIEIAPARAWLALAALAIVLGVGILWGVFGTLPRLISGSGVLVRPGGTFQVPALTAGLVREVGVRPGDQVTAGAPVAWIEPIDRATATLTGRPVPVPAPADGRILAILAGPGDVLEIGAAVVNLERPVEEMDAYLYVPTGAGNAIRPGQRAELAPATLPVEEFGYIIGRVRRVSEFPVSAAALNHLLHNTPLVDELLRNGPVLQVEIDLLEDPASASGYVWTSAPGPDLRLTAGTEVSGQLVLSESRPVSLLVPGYGDLAATTP